MKFDIWFDLMLVDEESQKQHLSDNKVWDFLSNLKIYLECETM